MRKLVALIIHSLVSIALYAQNLSNHELREDFNYFWVTIRDNYCYWDKKQTDWDKVKVIYQPSIDTVSTKQAFIGILEKAFYEIYDHHASLNTNTLQSQRLVPSGTDLWAEYINDKPTIVEVKQGSGAEKAGMRTGMLVNSFYDLPIEEAIRNFLPKSLAQRDNEAKNYALRLLLAGNHAESRKISVVYQNQRRDFYPDQPVNLLEANNDKPSIESKRLKGNIGYVLINNSLGDNRLIGLFDSVLTVLRNTKALIIDLRNTPSGGNTSVARAIMGRFITKEGFFQKHEWTAEEKDTGIKRSWVEIVSPRNPIYKNPLVVLVNHWTGSVGEGIAIGFDALKRATIFGTEMARLNGAVYSFQLPNTKIGFTFPAEKLFHVNGLPREDFVPAVQVNLSQNRKGEDFILEEALKYVSNRLVMTNAK